MNKGKILPLVYYPDKRLRQICEPAELGDLKDNFDILDASLKEYQGLGLAAPQLGIMKAMFVVDHDYIVNRYYKNDPNKPALLGKFLYIANPEIIEKSSELQEIDDGCLSLPGAFSITKRHQKIKIKYLGYDGEEQVLEAYGMLAACIQHEFDHTIGKLFIDYLSPLKREFVLKKVQKYLSRL